MPTKQAAKTSARSAPPAKSGPRSTRKPDAPQFQQDDSPKRPEPAKEEKHEDGQSFDYEPPKEFIIPPDQLQLSEKERNEEVTKMLKAEDPNAPENITRFSYKEKNFRLDNGIEHTAVHHRAEGYMIHRESDEAKRQLAVLEAAADAEQAKQLRLPGTEQPEEEDGGNKALKNQFNFSDRATQSFNNAMKDRSTATDPPPSLNFAGICTQWEIYDAFLKDIDDKREARDRAKAKKEAEEVTKEAPVAVSPKKEVPKVEESSNSDVIHSVAMAKALKIVERMVNQNAFDDISMDYKYWEDESDQFREGEGTLLPLWKFYKEKVKKKQVTAICWNPEYPDLFAVGYGSYDFLKQGSGLICCYSLKNPSHPEYTFSTETGVMCLDFHRQHSSLLAVGCYDGTVMVFDVRNKVNRPIFQSTVKTGKHTDPVWQICWQEEDLAKNLNFFSVATDGRVTLWTMSKNELQHTDVMELKLIGMHKDGVPDAEDDTALSGLAGGTCFDFNRHSDHLFLVGTEEGKIHKCSKAYNSQYLETYEGHHMAVYSVKWNQFHPRVFLSCSADWTVKLWDHNLRHPVMSFDLNNAVNDIAWAPYSSTVFSAVTSDGKVHVYDINENKHEPMCEQKVVRKAKLTHVTFNPKEPMMLVGDDRGCVTSLKLSPNLRKPTKDKDDEPPADDQQQAAMVKKKKQDKNKVEVKKTREQLEVEKLDKILAIAEKGESL